MKDKNGKIVAVNSELYVAQVKKESGNIVLEGGNEFTAEDELIHGSIKIKKYKSDGKTYYNVPTAENDFAAYLDAVLDYDKEEFMKKYEAYPYVQARYTLMEYVLKGAGFDLERIRADIK